MKVYVYNTRTHTLHIEGFCCHTPKGMRCENDYKSFETEDEAIAFAGRALGMCKLCQAERDRRMLNK